MKMFCHVSEEEDDIPTAELIAQMEKELAKRPIDRRESEGNFDSYLGRLITVTIISEVKTPVKR